MYFFRLHLLLHGFITSKCTSAQCFKTIAVPNLDLFAVCFIIEIFVTIFERSIQDNEFKTKVFYDSKIKSLNLGSSATLPMGLAKANSKFLD